MIFGNLRPSRRLKIGLAAGVAAIAVNCSCSKAGLAASLSYSVTWAGNTFGGARFTTAGGWVAHKHVQLAIDDMAVDSDGTVFTDSVWDEGGFEAGIYRNDDIVGNCQELSHGWGRSGGTAVAFDSNYVYVAMHQNGDDGANAALNRNGRRDFPGRGIDCVCIRRFDKAGRSAPFPAGYGIFGDMMVVAKAPRIAGGFPKDDVRGMAVRGAFLYVSDPYNSRIAVYDTTLMSGIPVNSWNVDSPGKICFDGAGRLWVLQRKDHPAVICYSASGQLLKPQISFASTLTPTAIAWDGAAGRILVADDGADQNIKLYDPFQLAGSPTVPASSFGVLGGIHSGIDGKIGALRFFDPSGVGADAAGNIYVANGGGSLVGMSLESYRHDGSPNWATPLQCSEFVNCAAIDPQSDGNIYSTGMHYLLDYDQPPGRGWSLKGRTLDRFKYPDDPRIKYGFRGGVWVRRINGVTYLFLTEQSGGTIGVERLIQSTDDRTEAPYALIAPKGKGQPERILRDLSGSAKLQAGAFATPAGNPASAYDAGWGEWVDDSGDIWQCGHGHIRHFKMHLDANGRPMWDYAAGDVELLDPPVLPNGAAWKHGNNPDDDDMDRIIYLPESDTMYIAGFTSEYPDNTEASWGNAGRVVYRFDHWTKERTIHQGYPILLPWDSNRSRAIKSICIAGDYLFGVQGVDPETVSVYDLDTGRLVGTMKPDGAVGDASGWIDTNIGISAQRRSNGEYIVCVEEDLYEKALIYRWTPPSQ